MKNVSRLTTPILLLTLCACGGASVQESSAHGDAPDDEHNHEHGHDHGHDGHGSEHGYHHDFSDTERFAARFDDPARDEWQRPNEIVELLELSDGAVVADIGAGTGYFIGPLQEAVLPTGRVLALDVSPEMIAHMQRRSQEDGWSQVQIREVPGSDPQLDAEEVERILIVNTWHHISHRVEYGRRLLHGLAPGGFVLVVDFNEESPVGPPAHARMTAEQISAELTSAGFETDVPEESLPYQYVVRARRPVAP